MNRKTAENRTPKAKKLSGAAAKGAGPGRPKGCPNKVTLKAREVIGLVIDGTAPKVQEWIDKIAETDPKGALAAYTALLEFGVPKLQRTELTGENGGPVQQQTVLIVQGTKPNG